MPFGDMDVTIKDDPEKLKSILELSEDEIDAEVFKAAIRIQNKWIENIETGEGMGSHGGPYVNTGEAANSIRIDPEKQGAKEYTIYSDKPQVLTAEIGQPPGHRPPFSAISDWVNEKLSIKKGDKEHVRVVDAIQDAIEQRGLEPFAPMEKAIIDVVKELEAKFGKEQNK